VEQREEWLPVAILLAKDMNCVCALLYLDTVMKPWVVNDILDILSLQVLHNIFNAPRAILMGKSYGGLLAHEFALKHPQQVISLVLFAPASTHRGSIERLCQLQPIIPLFLGWTGDDGSFTHRSKFLHSCEQNKEFMFHTEMFGGHALTEEYHQPIVEFLFLHKPT
jgi:pimeloyl-ACP methyl ester carboxylesterase